MSQERTYKEESFGLVRPRSYNLTGPGSRISSPDLLDAGHLLGSSGRNSAVLARLFSDIVFYFLDVGAPIDLLLSPKSIYLFPRGCSTA